MPISFASQDAEKIAADNLRELYVDGGIYAGANQFSDYWARDAFFASLGSNKVGDFKQSKSNLQLFLDNQKKDGQIPMRIGSYDIALKLLGMNIEQEPQPRYDQDKLFTYPRDQNCLIIIATDDYISKSGDIKFATDNFAKLEKSINWLASKDTDGDLLVEEKQYAGWTDSVKKSGEVLYTNVCYYKALASMSHIATQIGDVDKANSYALWAELLKNQINKQFWFEDYYVDWIDNKVRYTYFSTDGNILAIEWGVADKEKSIKILEYIDKQGFANNFGVQTATPYPLKRISPINLAVGIPDYHTEIRWLWLSCLYAKTLKDNGYDYQADYKLSEIKNKIVQDGVVYEVYEPNGKPLDRWFYKSEKPFAWSSGVCTYVFEELE